MLEDVFNEVYTKFKLNFYRGIFERLEDRDFRLSSSEAYAVEVIYALREPTISQFAEFLQISQPNATYKINVLMRKGYIKKVVSSTDKREYHLITTPKFWDYYAISQNYLNIVMQRIRKRFSPEETKQLESMLRIMSQELMPESDTKL
ncbi:MAG: MarR family winged helix-turn-helix transcriptional regulator [Clostridiales bacterium]|nr:MarR family winged helix-turn-helix transcriptional regulator [Clostridiales bacterium]